MTFHDLITIIGGQPWFDLPTLIQLSTEKRASLLMQISRWTKNGMVIPLKRGIYTLPTAYRRVPLNPGALAQALCFPSYISTLWAAGFYGLIPERVVEYTSMTTRATNRYVNSIGRYNYAHLKPDYFFGYRTHHIDGIKMILAEPEKALLDHWHLNSGEWTKQRMSQERYQNMSMIDAGRLHEMAGRFNSPRLIRAVQAWNLLAMEEAEGVRTI